VKRSDISAALRYARPRSFWLEDPARPDQLPRLAGDIRCDLAVVGGGYCGLWTALLAKEADPERDVVLLEADEVGGAASGRNGGFCAASLTHGRANGVQRFGDEIDRLDRLGAANLDAIEATLARHGIDAEFERRAELTVATQEWQLAELRGAHESGFAGPGSRLLSAEDVRSRVDSPTYVGGALDAGTLALVHPAKLAWGLKRACLSLGVRIVEHTPVHALEDEASTVGLVTNGGRVHAAQVAVATNAFANPLRSARRYTVPVYDYVLMTEPLDAEQLASIGWSQRDGISDAANQFHYYRLSADNRILWGGYDAVYYFGRQVASAYDHRAATYRLLARQFFETFPQLAGVRFSHRWGGAIDTCSRFCVMFGTGMRSRVAYAVGYTGLGVGATRFGAQVMLDLLGHEPTELTELKLVRSKPTPFPPEPLAWLGIQATRASIAQADRNGGKRNLWLRTLDRFGLGFDS